MITNTFGPMMQAAPVGVNPTMQPAMNTMAMNGAPWQFQGVGYTQTQPIQMTTGLTAQEIAEMKKNGNGAFRLDIKQEDMRKARCCHRDGNQGTLVSTNNPDKPNEVRCTLCGEVFNLLENVTPQAVTNACADFHDLANTIKVMYVDLPPKLINDIFQILPIAERMPALYAIACDRFNQFANGQSTYGQYMNPGFDAFGVYNGIMQGTAAAPNPYMYQQQQPVANPAMMQQPVQYAQPGMMPQQPMMQPMGMMNPMQAQMTANAPGIASNGFGYAEQPAQATQPTATTASTPTADGKPQVTKQLQA